MIIASSDHLNKVEIRDSHFFADIVQSLLYSHLGLCEVLFEEHWPHQLIHY